LPFIVSRTRQRRMRWLPIPSLARPANRIKSKMR
jgi:hypothetical protein